MQILFVLFILIIITLISVPYVALYWLIKPVTVLGYLVVFGLGSIALLIILMMIGAIQNYRANRS